MNMTVLSTSKDYSDGGQETNKNTRSSGRDFKSGPFWEGPVNLLQPTGYVMHQQFNPLKTKRRLLYLKTQFVPRSKHFSSRL